MNEVHCREPLALASFDVALFSLFRAVGPAIYLAQPIGLGMKSYWPQGLKVRQIDDQHISREQTARRLAFNFIMLFNPSPMGWAK